MVCVSHDCSHSHCLNPPSPASRGAVGTTVARTRDRDRGRRPAETGLPWGRFALGMVLTASLVALAACTTTTPHGPVPVRPVGMGSYSALAEPSQAVVRDPVAWLDLWNRHVAGTHEIPQPPPVYFDREMVVAVFQGRQSTAGYRIAITGAEVVAGDLRVYILREAPPPGGVTASVVTSPFHMVAMPQLPLPVHFIDIQSP